MLRASATPIDLGVNLVDYFDRPLSRRANAGVDWTRGRLSLGGNVQYFGSYRIIPSIAGQDPAAIENALEIQGAVRVPSQAYVDLRVGWRHRRSDGGGPGDVKVDFGVVNVLDRAPPPESSSALAETIGLETSGYSRYGDPRGRRLVLAISTAF